MSDEKGNAAVEGPFGDIEEESYQIDLLERAMIALRASAYTSDWDLADAIARAFGLDEVE